MSLEAAGPGLNALFFVVPFSDVNAVILCSSQLISHTPNLTTIIDANGCTSVFPTVYGVEGGDRGLGLVVAACGIEQVTRFPLPSHLYVQLDSCRSLLPICTSVVL